MMKVRFRAEGALRYGSGSGTINIMRLRPRNHNTDLITIKCINGISLFPSKFNVNSVAEPHQFDATLATAFDAALK
jgi:hypothetical protein